MIEFKPPLDQWTEDELAVGWGSEPDKEDPSPIGEAIKAEIDRRLLCELECGCPRCDPSTRVVSECVRAETSEGSRS